MALIEGLGDEVTLVLGSFFLIVILLLAWLSTHTEDIPLIREVGVIVVELRQRHRNRNGQQNRSDPDQQAPQEVEISQSSREGVLNSSETNAADSPESGVAVSNEGPETSQSSSAGSPSLDSSTPSSSPPPLATHYSALNHQLASLAHLRQRRQSPLSGSSSNNYPDNPDDNNGHGHVLSGRSESDPPTEEATSLRRIRQETEGQNVTPQRLNSDTVVSSDNASNGAQAESEGSHCVRDNLKTLTSSTHVNSESESRAQETSDKQSSVSDNHRGSNNKVEATVVNESSVPCDSANFDRLSNQSVEESVNGSKETGSRSTSQQQKSNDNDDKDVNENDDDDDDDDNILEGSQIRVKLKYMNETQRFVYASPDDTIGDFRRTHFQSELQDNKWVRFIFNGQDLRDDARTLQACNIENNCTMHCLVTTRQRPGDRPGEVVMDEDEESMLGAMMYPLFTILLMIVWYFRIFYRQYFSAMSTVCLIGISFLLGLSYVSSLRNINEAANEQQQQQQQQQPQSATGGTNHPHSD